jgi:ectoine hydroxylase-related dioxygenase (phytanoyl-CoA dioxygenase family)
MRKILAPSALEQFRDAGYYFPIPVLGAEEVVRTRAALAAFEAHEGGKISGQRRNKSHLFLKWLDEIVHHPKILDAVEDIIGPDILLYHAQWFIKEPFTEDFVSLHQDSAYWSLDRPDGLSAWLAFEDCDAENGCMEVISGTHKSLYRHVEKVEPTNMLWRGQTVDAPIDTMKRVSFIMKAGEMSLHHARIVHGSGPNRSARRRVGYSIRYIPTYVRREGPLDSAMLVRGKDICGHFELEPRPAFDYDPAAEATHARITKRYMENYLSATPENQRLHA